MSNESEAEEAAEDAADAAEGQDDEEPVDGHAEGDFVELAYTARTAEDGHLVDTTDAEVAEEEGVGEEREFAPRTIVLGQGHIFQSVEDDIVGKEVGDEGSVVVPAEEAFGEYHDDKVRTVSADKIPEDDRYPGAEVQVAGEEGYVETIIGGRARVDFNHPLAGEDIEYEYEVVGEVEDRQEKAEGLLSMFLDLDLNVWFETETVEEERPVEPDEDEAEAAESEDEEDEEATEADEGEAEEDEAEPEDDEDEEGDAAEEESEPEFETVEVEKESLYIEAIPQLSMNQQWMMQKQRIAQQLIDLLDVDRVVIQETIEGGGMGMADMFGGMGGGGAGLEEALEEADIDADDIGDIEELEEELESE